MSIASMGWRNSSSISQGEPWLKQTQSLGPSAESNKHTSFYVRRKFMNASAASRVVDTDSPSNSEDRGEM